MPMVITMDKIFAPFDEGQVKAINRFQRSNRLYPIVCGNVSSMLDEHTETDDGPVLVAEEDGLRCRVCGYLLSWVWSYMARR